MSEKVEEVIHKLPTPREDAITDIANEENDGVQVPCYFGSAVVSNAHDQSIQLVNLLIPEAESYEEAVGAAYLQVKEQFPPEEGWTVAQMEIEKEIVWADSERGDEDELPEFEFDMKSLLDPVVDARNTDWDGK